jgi:hypothetical protein
MVTVILLGILDVLFTIDDKISHPPYLVLTANDLLLPWSLKQHRYCNLFILCLVSLVIVLVGLVSSNYPYTIPDSTALYLHYLSIFSKRGRSRNIYRFQLPHLRCK